jgi:L-ascorbate metabolism protein UlaG (beta-lactamase superfamily)
LFFDRNRDHSLLSAILESRKYALESDLDGPPSPALLVKGASRRLKLVHRIAWGGVCLALIIPLGSCGDDSADREIASVADGADVQITPFVGAGVQLEFAGTVIHVDPWSRVDYGSAKPADLILITDTPADHLDPDLIAQLRKPGAPVVLPSTPEAARDDGSRERLLRVPGGIVMNNGDRMSLAGVPVEAVPMYDIIPGDPFHARGEGNGYVITFGGKRIYLSGVTECVPEIQTLENIDIAFMPMNLPNGRMVPLAADPYHYRERPIDEFVGALSGEPDIEVRVRDWYPSQ